MKTTSLRRIDLVEHDWHLRPDPDNAGLNERWFEDDALLTRSSDVVSVRIGEPWQRALGVHFDGDVVWYTTRVAIPEDWSAARTRFRCESVANECTVWINGKRVGTHAGDYIPFEFDITDDVAAGESIAVVVRVRLIRNHITKGFHDVLSVMHGGIWLGASILGSGPLHVIPNGVELRADLDSGRISIATHLAETNADDSSRLVLIIRDAKGKNVAETAQPIDLGASVVHSGVQIDDPVAWSPGEPYLYEAHIELRASGQPSEFITQRFGFRSVKTRDEQIIFNDRPVFLRGILHWGHEPKHLAPNVPLDELKQQFADLKSFGFNCVCLCMWYPAEHFFDLADEMGLLIWQEHPNWQAPMEDEHVAEYKRLYREFMRRDVQHPSVVIVSAACEHPRFHPEVARWWWETAHEVLPNCLLQVQTSSFAWSNPEETDLYDEHTYESNNRWITYLEDLQEKLAEFEVPKPFVMGETVLFHSWPDLAKMQEILTRDPSQRWWMPKALDSRIEVERAWRERYGDEDVHRFQKQGDRHHLLGRKFQMELFRGYRNHAALVTNHIRDVNACACGFMDDFDQWRFTADQLRPWLSDAILLLHTPNHRRSFKSGESIRCRLGISNFSKTEVESPIMCRLYDMRSGIRGECLMSIETDHPGARPGDVVFVPVDLSLPDVEQPERFEVELSTEGVESNTWTVWVVPAIDREPLDAGVYRLADLPFIDEDAAPDEWEKGYSRGFGLPAKRWINRLPDPNELVPDAQSWHHDEDIPRGARLIITHKLKQSVLDFLDAGGAVLHFASKSPQAVPTVCDWLFGQVPFAIEEPPLSVGDSDWLIDLLGFDLTRTYCRLIPVDDFDWLERVEPIVRLAFTHDLDHVRLLDMAFQCNVGPRGGRMVVSSFDHHDPAGRYLLRRMIDHLLEGEQTASGSEFVSTHELERIRNE